MSEYIYIVAGGTGGHISPGIAIAQELVKQNEKVLFISLEKNKEYADLVNATGFDVVFYDAPKLPSSLGTLLKFPFKMLKAYKRLNQLAKKYTPAKMIGMGGYSTYPALTWAKRKKIRYYLCEQNAHHGRITRMMGKKANKVFLSFDKENKLANEVIVGNPLRNIFGPRPEVKSAAIQTIFLIGGSQGARDLCDLYLEMIKAPRFNEITFIISAGKNNYQNLQGKARPQDKIFEFIKEMPEVLTQSDFIISRAGAGVVFEILWARRPSILLPYPYAADNHQLANAKALAEQGLAQIIDYRPFDATKAATEIEKIITGFNPEDWAKKERQALFGLEAAKHIAQAVKN